MKPCLWAEQVGTGQRRVSEYSRGCVHYDASFNSRLEYNVGVPTFLEEVARDHALRSSVISFSLCAAPSKQ